LTGFDCASFAALILTHPLFLLGHHASNGGN
jgi:hypothetical protein